MKASATVPANNIFRFTDFTSSDLSFGRRIAAFRKQSGTFSLPKNSPSVSSCQAPAKVVIPEKLSKVPLGIGLALLGIRIG